MTNLANNIREIIKNGTGATIISATIETEPKMKKTGNPFMGRVLKCQKLNGIIGFDYERSVNNLAKKEGAETREAKSRAWGTITSDKLFVEHTNKQGEFKTYLRMKVQKSINPIYIDKVTGEEISKEDLKPFLPVSRKSSTQSDLKGEVIERDIDLSNVKMVRIAGRELTN